MIMAEQEQHLFSTFQAVLTSNGVVAHASEVHGMLSGLICSGLAFESNDYLAMINDCFNNNEVLPNEAKTMAKEVYSQIWQSFLDEHFSFQLLLPDDDDTISERGNALSAWVQGFNLGFGLQHKDQPVTSEDVKEVLTDFAEIANLSDEIDENEESERAYFEISEYVRMSALLIFSELAQSPANSDKSETLH
jgi:yecA family protein